MLKFEDDEYAAILTTYTEARGALAKARITRGFYPVVVPADAGPQARFGRKGKPRPKGKGKGKGKPKGANAGPRPRGKPRPKPNILPQWGRPDRPSGSQGNRPAPICFRCGKTCHLSANCTNAPNAKRAKATDSAEVIIDMTPWANGFAEWRNINPLLKNPKKLKT